MERKEKVKNETKLIIAVFCRQSSRGGDAAAGPDSFDGLTKREGDQLDSNLIKKLFMKNFKWRERK